MSASFDELVSLFGSATNLPEPPASPLKLTSLLEEAEPDQSAIEECIHADPALTASVIKAASSAIFGRANPVTTVREATMVLGFKSLRSLSVALWSSALVTQSSHQSKLSPERFGKNGLFVACTASTIFKNTKANYQWTSDEIFTGGILANISWGLLSLVSPQTFDQIYDLAQKSQVTLDQVFLMQYSHEIGELGARATRLLGLPEQYPQAIEHFSNEDYEELQAERATLFRATQTASYSGHGIQPWKTDMTDYKWMSNLLGEQDTDQLVEDSEYEAENFNLFAA